MIHTKETITTNIIVPSPVAPIVFDMLLIVQLIELIFAKNRNGEIGSEFLNFFPETLRYKRSI